jgi:transposase
MSELVVAPTAVPQPRRSRDAVRHTWAERLARFETAGLTTAQFCAAEGVSVASFYLWKRRLAPADCTSAPATVCGQGPEPRLLPIRLPEQAPTVEVVLPSGALLRIAAGADEATLRCLFRLLGVPPC